ncbi:MAG TPA: response regulator [Chloroflexota bacterium]
MNRERFDEQVQDALARFHDRAYLQTHPLTRVLLTGPLDGREGAHLQRRLLAAIEELTPRLGAHPDVPEWRRARYLFLRYVERLSHEQVVAALGISHRQGHRDHHEGLASLASLLWSQRPDGGRRADDPAGLTVAGLVEAQAQRLAAGGGRGPSDLVAALDHALATTGELAASRGIRVRVAAQPDLPPAMVDRTVLGQVVLATLSLGIAGCLGSELAVDLSRDDQELRLAVAPCRRPSGEDEARLGVIGQLVEAQQGRVEVVERTGGAAVELVLPLARPRCVLVIDDDPDFVRLLTRYLVGHHYRAIAATDVEQGLRLASEARPDLVVLDVLMPSHDGWDVLRALRALPELAGVPIVVCSVLGDRALARSLGAADVLPKPVTQRALLAAIEAHCRPADPARSGPRSGS